MEGADSAAGWLEALAVVLAVLYLLLAVRESIWCWACAFASTAIYIYLFYAVALLSESLLNIFYLLMAVYGWFQWRGGAGRGQSLEISTWSWNKHLLAIAGTLVWVPVLGYYMQTRHGASMPYLDALTTCFAVVATYMVTRKILENWIYWFVIDAVSIYLYLNKGLNLTAGLFGLYLLLIVFGYLRWRRVYITSPPIA